MHRKSLAVWVGILALAIANGAIRESVLVPWLDVAWAHVLSTLMLCGIVIAVASSTITWIGVPSIRAALAVGTVWTILTLAFEFLAGRYLFGRSWEFLLADYDLAAGRLWILVPLTVLAAPALAFARTAKVNSRSGRPAPASQ